MSDPGDQYLPLLTEEGCDDNVIAHCLTVRSLALKIAGEIREKGLVIPDCDLVGTGAILHDIGRSVSHGMDHADEGVRICQERGLDEKICRIIGRHIGAGLTAGEREQMGITPVDTIPETIEEKIVAHADNMVKGNRIMTREEFFRSLSKFTPDIQKRFSDLMQEIDELSGR